MSKIKWGNKRAIQDIFNKFHQLGEATENDHPYSIQGVKWSFNPQQQQEWNQLIDSFISFNQFSKYFKRNTIQQEFVKIYSLVISEGKSIEDEISSLSTRLKESLNHEHTFIFKVDLLQTDKPYTFENIFIGDANTKNTDGVSVSDFTLGFLESLNNDRPGKKEFTNFINDTVKDTVIKIKEFGDQEFSKERAIETARKFLNEIAFFSNVTHFYKTQPCLEIDSPKDSKFIKINQNDLLISYGSIESEVANTTFFTLDENYDFQNEYIEKFTKSLNHFRFPIFLNGKGNEVLTRISTAINWYVDALNSNNLHTKFLFCSIGLESLFSINQSSPITETLSDNCAFLLGKNLAQRISIKEDVKKLYAHRSGVAHGRKPEILEKELNLVFEYLMFSILNLLDLVYEKELIDDKSLLNYFEHQKLDSSNFSGD